MPSRNERLESEHRHGDPSRLLGDRTVTGEMLDDLRDQHGTFLRNVDGFALRPLPSRDLRIIDWTKLALGARERDLLPFADAHLPEFLRLYLAEPATFELDVANFEHYIWRERLASVIDFGSLLLLEDARAEDRSHAVSELRRVLPIDTELVSKWIAWIRRCLVEAE